MDQQPITFANHRLHTLVGTSGSTLVANSGSAFWESTDNTYTIWTGAAGVENYQKALSNYITTGNTITYTTPQEPEFKHNILKKIKLVK